MQTVKEKTMITAEHSKEIAETYYEDILKFCSSQLNNEEDARDITQEVFLLFQKKFKELNDTNIKAWLLNVAQKKIFEKFREIKKNTKNISLNENTDFSKDASFVKQIDDFIYISDEEIEKEKFKIIEKLTPKERELFKMIYIERLKYVEIAERMGTTENAIAIRAVRLKQKIKKMATVAFAVILLIIFFFVFI